MRWWLCAVVVTGCFSKPGPPGVAGDDTSGDGGVDAPYAKQFGPFHGSVKLFTASGDDGTDVGAPALSANELELYYIRGANNSAQIYRLTRTSKTASWGSAATLGIPPVQLDPTGMPGGLELYYSDGNTLHRVTRASLTAAWEHADGLGVPTTFPFDISPDGKRLIAGTHASDDPASELAEYTREDPASTDWSQPAQLILSAIGGHGECCPTFSPDGLELFWEHRSATRIEIWHATRGHAGATFDNAELLDLGITTDSYGDPELSADGTDLYFFREHDGQAAELWVTHRDPID